MGDSRASIVSDEIAGQTQATDGNSHITPFPQLTHRYSGREEQGSWTQRLNDRHEILEELCSRRNVAIAAVFKAVWALVLGRYAGADTVGFCSIESGPNGFSATIDWAEIGEDRSVASLIDDLDRGLRFRQRHQQHSLAEIQDVLPRAGKSALNSILVIQGEQHAELEGVVPRKHYEVTEYQD
jgi:hypothetical protein